MSGLPDLRDGQIFCSSLLPGLDGRLRLVYPRGMFLGLDIFAPKRGGFPAAVGGLRTL